LAAVRSNGLSDEPQYKIEIDREKANAFSLTVSDVNTTLSAAWDPNSSTSLRIVAESKKCLFKAATTREWFQKTSMTGMFEIASGKMVPFAAFSQGSWIYGSPKLERYNGSPSAEILGEPAPGLSTGSAMDTMEKTG